MTRILTNDTIERRLYWIGEIRTLSGNFGDDATRLFSELGTEIDTHGRQALLGHLRLCGDIPEGYGHDSSEEKLYSKYTDSLLAHAFTSIGLTSSVFTERADAADVEALSPSYSLVADAKAFRLSRTAKNQKDFKIQAMDGWRGSRDFALVVCPAYQLPSRTSQIYEQAIARNVCILTYSHVALLVSLAGVQGDSAAAALLGTFLRLISTLPRSKDATAYWTAINRVIAAQSHTIHQLWATEKQAAAEALAAAKVQAAGYLNSVRATIMGLSHDDALQELLRMHKLGSRARVISQIADNGLLDLR